LYLKNVIEKGIDKSTNKQMYNFSIQFNTS